MTSKEPQEEFSIHWIRDIVQDVLERDPEQYLIVTGKSMSGSTHIGFMKEIIIADVIKRELQTLGKKAKTVFISDDYDPIRSFPPSLTLSPEEYMGVPYSDAPDPNGCCESIGAHWTNELKESFPEFGADPEVVLQSEIYKTKEYLAAIGTPNKVLQVKLSNLANSVKEVNLTFNEFEKIIDVLKKQLNDIIEEGQRSHFL